MYKTIFLFIFISASLIAQELIIPALPFSPKQYVCYRSSENICVDGKLDESSWLKSEWTSDFVDIEGSLKPLPRFKTRAKMLWDDRYFYVAAELSEPDIWATLKNRDDIIFYDNDFEVFIDPDGDTHSYLEYEMNAFNTIWDLLLKQPYRDVDNAALHGFDIKGILSGVNINGTTNKPGDVDEYWTVEIAFPWDAFKELTSAAIPPKENDQWRINFSRVEWQTEVVDGQYKKVINPATNKPFPEDNWVWSSQGVVNMHYPEMWGFVQFTNHYPGEKNVKFDYNIVEDVKWYLRQIYYKEKNYYSTKGFYTSDLSILKVGNNIIPGFNMFPTIECTTNMFEAYIISDDRTLKVSINNYGLTEVKKIVK